MAAIAAGGLAKGAYLPPRDMSDPQEDVLLVRLVEEHGTKNWSIIAKGIPGRTGKSCRIRYARPATTRNDGPLQYTPLLPLYSFAGGIISSHPTYERIPLRQRRTKSSSGYDAQIFLPWGVGWCPASAC